jgi:hypothetical protein
MKEKYQESLVTVNVVVIVRPSVCAQSCDSKQL